MKMRFAGFGSICLLVANLSCTRNSAGPPPFRGDKKIDLYYPDAYGRTKGDFELIISTGTGTVLLDTVAPVNQPVLADLHTNANLLDVTAIAYDVKDTLWTVSTFKSVDPATWNTAVQNGFLLPGIVLGSQPATVLFTHVPVPDTTFWQLTDDMTQPDAHGRYTTAIPAYLGTLALNLSYSHHANNALFLSFPSLGLYKYITPVTGHDTVDLSHPDTAVPRDYYEPGYTYTSLNVMGVPDTNDVSKSIQVFIPFFRYQTDSTSFLHFSYPAKYFEKYELKEFAFKNNDYVSYFSYGKDVPASITFPDDSYYTINSNQGNNFSVSFPLTRPTYYETEWLNSNVYYKYYAPPDSAHTRPVSVLASLKSRKLNGVAINDLALYDFGFVLSPDFDYGSYFSFTNNTARINMRKWSQFYFYSRVYQ